MHHCSPRCAAWSADIPKNVQNIVWNVTRLTKEVRAMFLIFFIDYWSFIVSFLLLSYCLKLFHRRVVKVLSKISAQTFPTPQTSILSLKFLRISYTDSICTCGKLLIFLSLFRTTYSFPYLHLWAIISPATLWRRGVYGVSLTPISTDGLFFAKSRSKPGPKRHRKA